jgi:predicted ester cyclase
MSRNDNITTAALAWPIAQTQNWDRLGEVYAWNVVDHDALEGQPPGLEGIKWRWRHFTTAFPDLRFETIVITADEQYVTQVIQLSGTHTGRYHGHAPTGRRFSIRMIQTFKFQNDMVSERWGSADFLGILQQLGLVSPTTT